MDVSIALATYNGEKYIKAQLDSLVSQTLKPCEIIICDDVSNDRTVEVCQEFKLKTSIPVHIYVNDENLRFANNFLKAASLCSGELIAFCDQDDVWDRLKLEACVKWFKSDGDVMLVGHNAWVVNEMLEKQHLLWKEKTCVSSRLCIELEKIPSPGFCSVFRSCLIKDFDFISRPRSLLTDYGYGLPHDQWVVFLATALGKIVWDSTPMALYRQHDSNKCSVPSEQSVPAKVKIKKQIKPDAYYRNHEIILEWSKSLEELATNTSHADLLLSAARFWRKVSKRWQGRGEIYSLDNSRVGRVICFVKLLLERGYCSRANGGLGAKSCAKDILFTISGLGIR